MGAFIDLTGHRFGRLTVVGGPVRVGSTFSWQCLCDCGAERVVTGSNLRMGQSQSCGCLKKELLSAQRFKHGFDNSDPVYRAWAGARYRCNQPKRANSKYYATKGIRVCKRWAEFTRFNEDMRPSWFPGATLERRNNNLGYSPSNCRWATKAEQAANRSNCRYIEVGSEKVTAAEFSRRFGLSYHTVIYRLNKGLPLHTQA